MFRWSNTIQSKQMMLAVVLSIVPLLIAGYFAHQIASDTIRENVENKLRQITLDKAEAIKRWMSERRADIALLSISDEVRNLLVEPDNDEVRQQLKSFYKKFSEQYGTYAWVIVRDASNKEIMITPEVSDRNTLTQLIDDYSRKQNHISEAFIFQGQAYFALTVPIGEENEEVGGTLTVVVDLEMLNEITDNINIGKTSEAYIVDSRGFFVTHQDRDKVLIRNYSDVDIIRQLISGEKREFVGKVIDYRNVPVLGAYHYLPGYKWGLIAEQDVAEAFRPLNRFSDLLVFMLIISAAVSGLVASWLTARNLKPLKQLSGTIKKIEEGRHSTRFEVRHSDEISQTGRLFNTMLDELEEIRSTLQQRVDSSDKSLRRAHEELKERHRELKQAQERLLHSERLSVMGEIAAGLAHEINNPLSTINMLFFSLQSEIKIQSDEGNQIIDIIGEEISKIAAMIDRFQDLTQPMVLRCEPVVMERVIDRAMTLVRPRIEKEKIEWKVTVDPQLPVIYGDERHLGQAFLNLLLNSIGAMPGGGKLLINVSEDTSEEGEDCVVVDISDTGVGISKENLENVFKPFFTTKAEGTGLGLLNVRKIVELHGGSIVVESTEGEGTTFSLFLPRSTNVRKK